jgi:malate dehydrogenase (oxaloacetate-decarboxylating)
VPASDQVPTSPDGNREALRLHRFYRGKLQTALKCPIRGFDDFAIWYTPGVAAPCRAIQACSEDVYQYTNKGNTIAIVSDGTRVLGLGNIGPAAGLPVMEGKALLFKYLGGVDAVPLCLKTRDPEELIRAVEFLEPTFGGINLEDISQPNCFRVLDSLRASMSIPVWHDDQQGTATVVLAGLMGALELVGKRLDGVRIVLVGIGAANVANYRLLVAAGALPSRIIACDRKGILHRNRQDLEQQQDVFVDKWRICCESNADQVAGGIPEALRGADVCLAFSAPGPGTIQPEWIRQMAGDAVVFSCANPVPEIWPDTARGAGARIVATGRSDFYNQVNNSLVFPAIFRGALDVRAKAISNGMAMAAARELARVAREQGLHDRRILPPMDDLEAVLRVSVATAMQAQSEGCAQLKKTQGELKEQAATTIRRARAMTECLIRAGVIPEAPSSESSA